MLNKILPRLSNIDHIPSHPLIKKQIKELINYVGKKDPGFIENLSDTIIFDPSLTIEFLKIANSDSFSFKNKIASLDNALLVLDNDLIELIITQHPVLPELEEYDKFVKYEFVMLVKHSIEVRIIMDNILKGPLGRNTKIKIIKNELLTAAILHEIGLFFYLIYFPEDYYKIKNKIGMENIITGKTIMFPDHSLLGSILCRSWNLPDGISSSIAFHHFPWSCVDQYKTISELLFLADNISSSYYEIYYPEDDIFSIEEHIIMKKNLMKIIDKLNMSMIDIANLRMVSGEETLRLFSLWNI